MIVVGLDLSLTNAGIAVLTDGRPTLLTSVGHGGKDGATYQHRSRRVRSQCQSVLAAILSGLDRGPDWQSPDIRTIDLAVIEGPSYGSVYGDPFDRAGLWHGVFGALDAKRVPVAVVAPGTLKKWATGAGNAKKPDVLAAAREWCRPANHDEADAAWLALMGSVKLGAYPVVALTSWRINGFDAVTWPEKVTA